MMIIDMDSHSTPRPEDYTVPLDYSHLRPRTYVDAKGTRRVVFNNKIIFQAASGEKGSEHRKKESDGKRGAYDGSFRCKEVTEAGVNSQFVMAGSGVTDFHYVDATVGAAFCRAHNDFLYNVFMKPFPQTFSGLPSLPIQDIRAATKELERCVKDLGMRTFVLPTNWKGKDIADPYWWGLYDCARNLGIRLIIFHIEAIQPDNRWVGQERLGVLGPDGTRGRRIVSTPFEYCTNILNLIFGGLMDSFPEFNFLFLEGCAEFVIPLKRRAQETVEQLPYLRATLSQPLQKYFDRLHFLIDDSMLENDGELLLHAIRELGVDHLLFGSDYPHDKTGIQMSNQLMQLSGLSTEVKEKILGKNALRLLGTNPFE